MLAILNSVKPAFLRLDTLISMLSPILVQALYPQDQADLGGMRLSPNGLLFAIAAHICVCHKLRLLLNFCGVNAAILVLCSFSGGGMRLAGTILEQEFLPDDFMRQWTKNMTTILSFVKVSLKTLPPLQQACTSRQCMQLMWKTVPHCLRGRYSMVFVRNPLLVPR